MTLKFNRVLAVVEVHVHAKFREAIHRFMSYREHREKSSDENNTVRRYRGQ